MSEANEIAERLSLCGDDLANLAVQLLRTAVRANSEESRVEFVARERRVTRARRAVEKAVNLLGSTDLGSED